METIVAIPSEWVLAYLVGMMFCFYKAHKTDNVGLYFVLGMIYLLVLTIGLRLYYA
jgi:hypothetical protein